jgi:hypothetical protein
MDVGPLFANFDEAPHDKTATRLYLQYLALAVACRAPAGPFGQTGLQFGITVRVRALGLVGFAYP